MSVVLGCCRVFWSVLEVFYGRFEVLGGWGFGSGLVEVQVVGDRKYYLKKNKFFLTKLFFYQKKICEIYNCNYNCNYNYNYNRKLCQKALVPTT